MVSKLKTMAECEANARMAVVPRDVVSYVEQGLEDERRGGEN